MPAIPEQFRPYVAALAKYHFWILAAIVPIVLVPLLFSGTSKIDREIQSRSQEIDNRVSALKSVQGIESHPNEGWTEVVEAQTKKIQEETISEWQRFWKDQEPLRVWPKRLGDDFIKAVSGLKPGGTLNRAFLQRYQNTVQELARDLPKRMGADDLMAEGAVPGGVGIEGGPGARGPFGGEFGGPRGGPGGEFGGPRPGFGAPATGGSTALVQWADADQKRVLDSFTFDTNAKRSGKDVISTTQVLLAQEDLWVYGLFCDVIKKLNENAPDRFEAPISSVSELAVGYPAAEDQPGGQGGGRIQMMSAPGAAGGEFGGEGMPSPEMVGGMGMPGEGGMAAAGRPLNPRFSGGGSMTMMGPGGPMGGELGGDPSAVAPVASPDEQLKEWIYVDFSGKPLTAAELGTLPAAKMVHLVPFRLGVMMDQRKLDALLTELATNPVPIDVRQVRINPSQQSGGGGGRPGGGEFAAPSPSFPSTDAAGTNGRPYDVFVELRGTVGLAPVPDPKTISGGDAAPAGGGT